jgi:parallel beta-helix repeat protein
VLRALLVIAALAGVVRGGPLDPPASPGSTQQNLIFQPSSCAGFPITISQSGSYKLAQNITMPAACNKIGIDVNASNVTIDLQGFELAGGANPGTPIGTRGIDAVTVVGLTVRDGTVRDWADHGIFVSFGTGLLVDGVRLRSNGTGVHAEQASTNAVTLTNCHVSGSIGHGIIVGNGSVISKCTSTENGLNGITTGLNATITEVVAAGNGLAEISALDGSTLENCVADGRGVGTDPAIKGITVGRSSIVRGCTARHNPGDEITAGPGSLVEDCVADGWTGSARGLGNGIVLVGSGSPASTNSTVRGCTVVSNFGVGISATGGSTSIEANHITNNDKYGIELAGANNTIRDNELVRVGFPDIHLLGTASGNPATGTVLRDTTVTGELNCVTIEPGASILSFSNSWHSSSC